MQAIPESNPQNTTHIPPKLSSKIGFTKGKKIELIFPDPIPLDKSIPLKETLIKCHIFAHEIHHTVQQRKPTKTLSKKTSDPHLLPILTTVVTQKIHSIFNLLKNKKSG